MVLSDPLGGITLVIEQGPVITEFDDAGYEFRMYDSAVAHYRSHDGPGWTGGGSVVALRDSYRGFRPLSNSHWKRLATCAVPQLSVSSILNAVPVEQIKRFADLLV